MKLSIIIPIYNAEKYLEECIRSAMNQTLQDIEIILIDDGSTDSSAKICKKLIEEDARIIYYYKENEGLAAARQDGINLAHGEYIGFLDADDWIEPNMYEAMYSAAKDNNSDVVLCNAFINNEAIRKIELSPGAYCRKEIEETILPESLISIDNNGQRHNIRWSNCIRIYKKELLEKNNISFDRSFRRCQDFAFTLDCMLKAESFYYIDSFLYHNRQEAGSLSRGYTKNMWSLIKPLIVHINHSVINGNHKELLTHVSSTDFFLILDCIFNELKNDAPSKKMRIAHIQEILNDEICISCLQNVEYNRLCSFYRKIFYLNMKNKAANKLLRDYHFYYSRTRKIISPAINYLTELPLVKKIRGK